MNSSSSIDFVEQGYAVRRSFLTQTQVSHMLRWIDQFDGELAPPPTMEPEYESCLLGGPKLRKLRRLFWHDQQFWKHQLEGSGLFDLGRMLLAEEATLIFHAAFMKPALVGSAVGFHQDQALYDHEYPGAISVWIALSSCRLLNGCLIGYPRSHKLGLVPHLGPADWHPTIDVTTLSLSQPVCIEMEPGDVAWWHRYFIHGSGPNRSTKDRRGMGLVFAKTDAKNFLDPYTYSLS